MPFCGTTVPVYLNYMKYLSLLQLYVFGDCTIKVSSAIDVLLDSQLADTN